MKDSGIYWIGTIPTNWEIKRLQFCLTERNLKNSPIQTNNILSLSVRQGVTPYSERKGGGNKAKEDLSAYKIVKANDIVMNSMNVIEGAVGMSPQDGCISPVYYIFYSKNLIETNFYNFLFQTKEFQRSLVGLGNGILIRESSQGKFNTIRMRIPIDKLNRIKLPCPPKKEMGKIVSLLSEKISEINALKSGVEKQIETLQEFKKSIIFEIASRGLNPEVEMQSSKIDYIGQYPKKWTLTRLKYVCTKLDRPVYESSQMLVCSNKGTIEIRTEKTLGLISEKKEACQGVKKGDLLIHGMDTWHGAIGISDFDGKCTRVVHVCDSKHNKRFICYFLKMLAIKSVYKAISMGVRENSSDFRSWIKAGGIYITLPDLQEQVEIANFLDEKCKEIDSIIKEKQTQLQLLDSYKKSFIYEVTTGKRQI